MKKRAYIPLAYCAAICSAALAQNAPLRRAGYLPIESNEGKTPIVKPVMRQASIGALALTASRAPGLTAGVAPSLSCSTPPTTQDVLNSGFSYDDSLLTTDEAASLSIPFVKINGSANTVVLVRDYISSIDCLASDNKTLLTYGVSLRTIITVDNFDAKLDASYAAIAADATYNHKTIKVNIQAKGISNGQYFTLITQIAGKDFNVDNFPAFYDSTSAMIKLIGDTSTTITPTLLGVVTILDDMTLTKAPAITWALTEILAKHTCTAALTGHFDQNATFPKDAITSTYQTILGKCDNATTPTDAQKSTASNYLAGLKAVKQ